MGQSDARSVGIFSRTTRDASKRFTARALAPRRRISIASQPLTSESSMRCITLHLIASKPQHRIESSKP
eukprot:8944310-Pyramimonas_sp.AAC.1